MFGENEYFWFLWANFYFTLSSRNICRKIIDMEPIFIKPPSHYFCSKTLVSERLIADPRPRLPLELWNPSPPVYPVPGPLVSLWCHQTISRQNVSRSLTPTVLSIRWSGHNWLTLWLHSCCTLHCTLHCTLYMSLYTHCEWWDIFTLANIASKSW